MLNTGMHVLHGLYKPETRSQLVLIYLVVEKEPNNDFEGLSGLPVLVKNIKLAMSRTLRSGRGMSMTCVLNNVGRVLIARFCELEFAIIKRIAKYNSSKFYYAPVRDGQGLQSLDSQSSPTGLQ